MYDVLRDVGKNLQFKLSMDCEEDWDLFWTDNAVQPETLVRMKNY